MSDMSVHTWLLGSNNLLHKAGRVQVAIQVLYAEVKHWYRRHRDAVSCSSEQKQMAALSKAMLTDKAADQ